MKNQERAREIVAGLIETIEAHNASPETAEAPEALEVEALTGMRVTLELGGPTTWITLRGEAWGDGSERTGELQTSDPETGELLTTELTESEVATIWAAFDPGVA
jgi:hypothetical protein